MKSKIITENNKETLIYKYIGGVDSFIVLSTGHKRGVVIYSDNQSRYVGEYDTTFYSFSDRTRWEPIHNITIEFGG